MKRIYSYLGMSILFGGLALCTAVDASAKEVESIDVPIYMITTENASGLGESVGIITIMESPEGLIFKPVLKNIPAGEHGFHLHENPALGPKEVKGKLTAGLEAGGHYDPAKTGKHLGPYDANGHFGDLPLLVVDEMGMAPAVLAPRITTLDEIYGRSIMIHMMGDNYSDTPTSLGGGGARMAGGIIKK